MYICAKCNVEMEEVFDIAVSYKGMDLPETDGFTCPCCSINFITEEKVVDEVMPAEMMLESK